MMNPDAPIGIFDSGLGGLTVAREVIRQMPEEKIVYFGDTARVPYGSKSKNTIIHFAEQIIHFLSTMDVKAIVVACNTASAYALEEVRHLVDVPMIGVVKPGARVAAAATKNKRIGIIGTEGTVKSGVYSELITSENPDIRVFSKACPLLVSLVEEGWWHDSVTTEVVRRYVAELRDKEIDTLIMGCTHYPLLRPTFQEVLGVDVRLINPAYETALECKKVLSELGLLRQPQGKPVLFGESDKYRFFVSDDAARFRNFATQVLRFGIMDAKEINIEEY